MYEKDEDDIPQTRITVARLKELQEKERALEDLITRGLVRPEWLT